MQRYSLVVFMLGALATIAPLSIDAYLPAFAAIGRAFASAPALVQQTLSVYLFAYALMSLFHGTLSDSFGRRPVILASLLVYTVGSLFASFAPSIAWLIFGRALQGLSAGAGMTVGQAIVRDSFDGPRGQRTLSYITMVFGVSPALAPIIGGWLAVHLGWRSVFNAMALVSVVVGVMFWRFQPETLAAEKRHAFSLRLIITHYRTIFTHRQFMLLSLSLGFTFGGFAFFIGSAPNFILDVLHLRETDFGWLFVPLVIGMISGSWAATRCSIAWPGTRITATGFVLMGASCLDNVIYNCVATPAVPWAVLPIMVFSFGLAFALPSMTMRVLDLVPERAGMAASVLSFVQMVMFSIVSGILVPFTFGSGLKMALGVSLSFLISCASWYGAGSAVPTGRQAK